MNDFSAVSHANAGHRNCSKAIGSTLSVLAVVKVDAVTVVTAVVGVVVMRSCRSAFLFWAILLWGIACSDGNFRGGGDVKGNSVPEEHPQDQSQQDKDQPRNEQGNPTDKDGEELPRPGKGVDPKTGRVPTSPNYNPRQDPHSPYNPESPNYNPNLPPFSPTEPYGPGTNPGGPGVNIFPPRGVNEPGFNPNGPGAPLFPGDPGYFNPYGPNGPYQPILTERVFNVTCDNGVNVIEEFQESENQRIKAIVKGQLCPQSMSNTLVLFIVDVSGSMGPHFDDDINANNPGHDTMKNGTCGRLKAAQQIVNRVSNAEAVDVDVAMIPFAGEAIESRGIRPTSIDRVGREINADKFCGYVPQNNNFVTDGAWSGTGASPDTNYAAAFNAAHAALRSSGRENAVIYFISDGEPTIPGPRQNALDAGIAAGMELRNDPEIRSLIVNGLYLGIKGSETYKGAAGVLAQVTGSPNRVLPAENAAQLADVITQFPSPTINLNADEYRKMAWLEVRPFKREDLGIQSMQELSPNLWEYQTQPFLLLGLPGKTIENRVGITIIGRNGFLYKTTVKIMYHML